MANKFTGITSAGVNVPVYDKEAHQALGNVYTKSEVDTELNTKQDKLSTEQLYNIDHALTTSAGLMEESKLSINSNHITAYNGIPFSAQGGGGGGATYEGVAPIVVDNTEKKISADTIDVNYQQIVHDDSLVHVSNNAQYALGVNLPMFSKWVDVTSEWTFNSTYFVSKPTVLYNDYLKMVYICGSCQIKSIGTGWTEVGSFPAKYTPAANIEKPDRASGSNTFTGILFNINTVNKIRMSCGSSSTLWFAPNTLYPCKGGV